MIILILCSISSIAQTKIIAHRGFSDIAPENTLVAFKKAIDVGADYLELDVRKTKDNVLVVIHDFTIDRTSSNNRKGKIAELDFAELKNVHVGYSKKFGEKYKTEKILTLKESLQFAKGKIKVCIELKVVNIENQVMNLLNELEMVNDIIVFSFDYETVKNIKILNPKIETLFLKHNAVLGTIDSLKTINANAIGVGNNTEITKDFLAYAHKNKIKVFKWTVNKEEEMRKLIDLKLDGLITNKPDIALTMK